MRFFSTLVAATLGTLIALGLIVVVGFLFLIALIASADSTPSVPRDAVLVVRLQGAIPEYSPDDPIARALGEASGTDLVSLRNALRMAERDRRIRAVWVQAGGLAGPWATLEEVRTHLERVRRAGKPVVASLLAPHATETDLFVASTAESLYAAPLTIVEANGFVLQTPFFKRALDRLGVTPEVVRAGTFKAATEPFFREDLSPENRQQLQGLLDAQNAVFLEAVARSRRTTPARLQALMAGAPVFGAEEARHAGLVDALVTEAEVHERLRRRLGLDEDERLRTVTAHDYARTSPKDAGLDLDDTAPIAVVLADGDIADGESGSGGLFGVASVGHRTFVAAMREARENEAVKAVVVRINSPGGSASASEAMRQAIEETRRKKPVVASMGDYAASGGYWIAMGADSIVAQPLTITGSIGVFTLFFDARRFFDERLGVTFDAVQTSPFADLGTLSGGLEAPERALLQQGVDSTYARFLSLVARNRRMALADVDSIAQGRVWSGRDAHRFGLVDRLGGLREAIAIAARRARLNPERVSVRLLPRPKTFTERLTESLQARVAAWQVGQRSPAEQGAATTLARVRSLAALHGQVQALLPWRASVR
ncbi:MAG TPA: signal peptide peptidase SppA [Rhodothermales bacterium]|nr:signal peptide peptidase SppA [Rhodothermales bacterium]